MALTLDDLGKKRKENKLNYNSENKALPFSPSKTNEVAVKKGELTKPASNIEKVDNNLKRIQEKTDRILERTEKAQQREVEISNITNESPTRRLHIENTSHTNRQQINRSESKKSASAIELHCLKGLPKLIIANVKKNATYDSFLDKWIAILDTDELKILTNKSAKHISVQMLRLEKQKWFKILKSNNAGARVLEIQPEIYSINR